MTADDIADFIDNTLDDLLPRRKPAMTPTEARAAFFIDLPSTMSPSAWISVRLNRVGPSLFECDIYPDGMGGGGRPLTVNADTLDDLYMAAVFGWHAHAAKHRADRTRKMALAIIDITGTHGECPATHLRMAGFTDAEIADLGAYAVTEANTLSERRPFSIAATLSNAA